MEREILPGWRCRHFKGGRYEVLHIARHSETGERLVIYRALYGEGGVWARPYAQFAGAVDREKYPDAAQYWRFEQEEDEQ